MVWIMGNPRENSFQQHIVKDPHCAVGIVYFDVENRIVQHVGFRGHARIEPFDRETAANYSRSTWEGKKSSGT